MALWRAFFYTIHGITIFVRKTLAASHLNIPISHRSWCSRASSRVGQSKDPDARTHTAVPKTMSDAPNETRGANPVLFFQSLAPARAQRKQNPGENPARRMDSSGTTRVENTTQSAGSARFDDGICGWRVRARACVCVLLGAVA